MVRLLALLLALAAATIVHGAEPLRFDDQVGDVYELRLETKSESSGPRSSGSSTTRNVLIEQVVAVREGGMLELEFDLPAGTSADDRARSWQFPARVLKLPSQPLQLLNEEALSARNQAWLEAGQMPASACGHWVFTWTAIKIECDPNSVLGTLAIFDLRLSDLRDGALYVEAGTLGPVPLRETKRDGDGATYVVELQIDPEVVRQARAASAVAVAEMTGQAPITVEAALEATAGDKISGTLVTTIEVDAAGRVRRCTRASVLDVTTADGSIQRQTSTTIIEREPVSKRDQPA